MPPYCTTDALGSCGRHDGAIARRPAFATNGRRAKHRRCRRQYR